jgi:hypothetical protein
MRSSAATGQPGSGPTSGGWVRDSTTSGIGRNGEALRAALTARRPAVLDVPMVNEPVPTPGHWNIKDIYRGVFD